MGIPGRGNRKCDGNEAGVYMFSTPCVRFSPNDQPHIDLERHNQALCSITNKKVFAMTGKPLF